MKSLLNLFEENFKPCDTVPVLGLTKNFIIKNGFNCNDIRQLTNDGKIEKCCDDGYRMTSKHIKEWSGSSYKHIPEAARW